MRQLNSTANLVGRIFCASLFAVFATPSFGSPIGDTVSPIDVSMSAACGNSTINISYRNNWVDGSGALGIRSLLVNGHAVTGGATRINAAIRNARIAGISFIRCQSRSSEFLVLIRVDSGDVRRLGISEMQYFSIGPSSATPAT